MEKISVIVSCFNEEKALPLFYKEMEKQTKNFEIIRLYIEKILIAS